ncbi:MAG TPA: threonine--tRNA ligase [Candidatus Polarisedimenticolia bacterium]|nr:threonine--tRNA ligase [Candidatus Polarisedimenticolia bacterium]
MSTTLSGDAISVTLPDGKRLSFPKGVKADEVVRSIGPRLAKDAVAVMVDGEILDLGRSIESGGRLRVLTAKDPEALEVLRHSTAHLTAHAVKELFPEVQIGVGPVVEEGYYYDFLRQEPFTPEDLERIEAKMRELAGADFPIRRLEMPKDEALAVFKSQNDALKVELVAEKGGPVVSCYQQDRFIDFCLGPHLPSTGRIKAFKLLSVAGAYWKGDERNAQLQRIYGTSFFSKEELQQHLDRIEEARRRDHRKLGRELGLFSFHPESPAAPFFHPRGAVVYNTLIDYVRGLYRDYGYDEVITPQIFDLSLFDQSGHLANYRENMYFAQAGDKEFGVKPMNCPSHTIIYRNERRSYRDLPMRLADFGRLHRFERSGVLAGLTRVRSFSQDDAHIFCAPEQAQEEVRSTIRMITSSYRDFGFEARIYLSTRPAKAQGSAELWQRAEALLKGALEEEGTAWRENPGEGAFYAPKIDFLVLDALQREHQLGTIQVDFTMPERFDLKYASAEGGEARPVMIHRAMLGSLERFIGILVEHFAGAFPVWLAPVQAVVLPITDRVMEAASAAHRSLRAKGFRVALDGRSEKIGHKIRDAQLQKIPFMLVIGDREAEAGTVAVRSRSEGDRGAVPLAQFETMLAQLVSARALKP